MAKKYQPGEIKEGFNFSVPIQIRYSDIDGYLHVNNGVYFNYMEHARALYLYQVCNWNFLKTGAVVANINLDFFKPIHLFDQPKAFVRCLSMATTSFVLEQVLMGKKEEGEEEVFSRAVISMVTVDLKTLKPTPLPDEYIAKIRKQDHLIV